MRIRYDVLTHGSLLRLSVQMATGRSRAEVIRHLRPAPVSAHGAVLYLPPGAARIQYDIIGGDVTLDGLRLSLTPLRRPLAAVLAILQVMRRRPSALSGVSKGGPLGFPARLRSRLGKLVLSELWERSYRSWVQICEPRVVRLVRAGLADMIPVPVTTDITISNGTAEYVALLDPYDVPRPDALAIMAAWATKAGCPPVLMADEDRLGMDGTREAPQFKPHPSHMAMLSGTLCGGLWLVRRDVMALVPPGQTDMHALRLALWLAMLRRDGRADTARVPLVLTSRPHDAPPPDTAALARVVAHHLEQTGLPMSVRPAASLPLFVQVEPRRVAPGFCSIIVPSRCRGRLSLDCLRAVLATTREADRELVLVLSDRREPDAEQRAFIDALGPDRIRVVRAPMKMFNYSAANNAGVRAASGEAILLLNDDVEPRDRGWLTVLMGHLADPGVGAVGAKLLYPDRSVQHCGVILGHPGQCHHAGRRLPAESPGYMWRNQIAQEFSVVTGACMLVRRQVFDALGGLDERYPSAFNDVDFCLRVRRAGWRIVLSTQSEIIHQESLSFGAHYGGAYAEREQPDTDRLATEWADAFEDDPFYNPNLSLTADSLFELAFPSRAECAVPDHAGLA